jgi:CDP-diacylglycerol--serine O-phosphatidyltransferase
LIAAGGFALADGLMSRSRIRTTAEKRYGIQIRSRCDTVGCGVLPAFLFYHTSRGELPSLFRITVPLMYIMCAVVKQAYFAVAEDLRIKTESEPRAAYLGFPVSLSALAVPALWCARPLAGRMFFPVYTILMVILGISYVTPFVLKKPKWKLMAAIAAVEFAVLILLIWESGKGLV